MRSPSSSLLRAANLVAAAAIIAVAVHYFTSLTPQAVTEAPAPGIQAPPETPKSVTTAPEKSHHSTPVLFRIENQFYHQNELPLEFSQPLYEIDSMAHRQRLLVLEQALTSAYINQVAKKEHSDSTAVLQKLYPDTMPSEDSLQQFYDENRQRNTPPFEQIRDNIRDYLYHSALEENRQKLLTELLIQGKAEFLMDTPTPPNS